MAAARRLLVVDDEPAILQTLSQILSRQGFEVVTKSNVADALQAIASVRFDILIADLNIGEPGDGFTVVSALRRTYPEAIAVILTGYPGFDAALKAIREQVDDFLVKPIHPAELVKHIETLTRSRPRHQPLPLKPLAEIVRAEKEAILARMLITLRERSGEHDSSVLSDESLVDSLPGVIDELCERVQSRSVTTATPAAVMARTHGRTRYSQGYGLAFILDESTALRQMILDAVHRNLLLVDLSSLLVDLSFMSVAVDQLLKLSITEYARLALGESERTRH